MNYPVYNMTRTVRYKISGSDVYALQSDHRSVGKGHVKYRLDRLLLFNLVLWCLFALTCSVIYRETQKKRELLKNPTKIEEIQEKKFIDRNLTIATCLLRDSNPNYHV
jgi:tmRNA-binding protein